MKTAPRWSAPDVPVSKWSRNTGVAGVGDVVQVHVGPVKRKAQRWNRLAIDFII